MVTPEMNQKRCKEDLAFDPTETKVKEDLAFDPVEINVEKRLVPNKAVAFDIEMISAKVDKKKLESAKFKTKV